jgi:hypothetical protein
VAEDLPVHTPPFKQGFASRQISGEFSQFLPYVLAGHHKSNQEKEIPLFDPEMKIHSWANTYS